MPRRLFGLISFTVCGLMTGILIFINPDCKFCGLRYI
jgi:hypothetical protein